VGDTYTLSSIHTLANDGASRIDRFYATETLIHRKEGTETVAAAFPDHFAVIVLMAFDTPLIMCRASVWRMNIILLEEPDFREAIKDQWGKWQRHIQYVKRKIKQTFQREGARRNRDKPDVENCYYDMIYRVLREHKQANKASHLKKLKDKIIRLNSIQLSEVFLDTDERDRITGEDPTSHQYLKSRKVRAVRTINHALDENGHLKTDQTEIMHIFADHMTR